MNCLHRLKEWFKTDPKRWVLGVVLPLLLVWAMGQVLGSSLTRDQAWARIQREHILRVGMDASYPPFEIVDGEGHYSGFDVDLATALAERWQVTPMFANVHFDGLYDALKTEKFDLIISALPYDRTMTRDVLYSQSYFNAGQVLVGRRNGQLLESFADLDGRQVAVELGAEAHQLVRQLARDRGLSIEIVTRREPDEVIALLREGSVNAVVCDRVLAHGYLLDDQGLFLVGEPLTDDPYVIAARLDSPVLMKQVEAALNAWREDGLIEDLQRRWF